MKRFSTGKTPAAVSRLALLAALALGGIAGCATNSPTAVVGQTNDVGITSGVKAALLGDASLKASEIDVATDQGVVRLSGFVSSADDVAAAAAAARTVRGVRSVRNELRLK
ncbi:MAG: BON domain-containing protein [Massilia sp.]|jgi:hyperosmotically inducible protein